MRLSLCRFAPPAWEKGPKKVPKEVSVAKVTVEECFSIDIAELVRPSLGCPGFFGFGPLRRGGETLGSFMYVLGGDRLQVSWPFGPTSTYEFSLTRTPTSFGGERTWFSCPRCGRRVGKLYLPPGHPHFWCRHCHGLSYGSRQQRVPPLFQALTLLCELRAEKEASPPGSRRSARRRRREDRLYEVLEKLDLEEDERRQPSPADPGPKRGRGRPKEKRPYTRTTALTLKTPRTSTTAYCPKCRDRREMVDPYPVTFANGRPALQGHCPVCGTKMARIVKQDPPPSKVGNP